MQATNIRRLLAAIWSDGRGRRWLLLSQLALLVMVVFDLLIPQPIRGIVNNGILAGESTGSSAARSTWRSSPS